ncbi:hypothetical protein O3W44_12960 [Pantoea sp. LMR881]|uniref:hypothetical protein n=1 Tax=Pantoea sp. LMR881 TaxID=3014336 RepID=UPI0022AFBA9F|nr:hypothetical protein [Pantoea sp. LMR881]MCZ4059794.1 hypothetical protein [Pantoea sp. LMR881]
MRITDLAKKTFTESTRATLFYCLTLLSIAFFFFQAKSRATLTIYSLISPLRPPAG